MEIFSLGFIKDEKTQLKSILKAEIIAGTIKLLTKYNGLAYCMNEITKIYSK
jgi:hypothetical protein